MYQYSSNKSECFWKSLSVDCVSQEVWLVSIIAIVLAIIIVIVIIICCIRKSRKRSKNNEEVNSVVTNPSIAPNAMNRTAETDQPSSSKRFLERLRIVFPSYATPNSNVYQPLICIVFEWNTRSTKRFILCSWVISTAILFSAFLSNCFHSCRLHSMAYQNRL